MTVFLKKNAFSGSMCTAPREEALNCANTFHVLQLTATAFIFPREIDFCSSCRSRHHSRPRSCPFLNSMFKVVHLILIEPRGICTRVVKILENHTLDLASNYEVFSRVSLKNASKIEGFRGLTSKMPQTFQLLEASASKFEVLKPTLEKPSIG